MKNAIIFFALLGLILFASKIAHTQIAVSHDMRQTVTVSYEGCSTIIPEGGTGILVCAPSSGRVSLLVDYLVKGRPAKNNILTTNVVNGEIHISAPEDADVVSAKDERVKKAYADQVVEEPTERPGSSLVHVVDKVLVDKHSFKLKVKNSAGVPILFVGDILNGVPLKPQDSLISYNEVDPGMIHVTALYENPSLTTGYGQSLKYRQQALSFLVLDEDYVVEIKDSDVPRDQQIYQQKGRFVFKNVGSQTIYINGRAVRPGRFSKRMSIKAASNATFESINRIGVKTQINVMIQSGGEKRVFRIDATEGIKVSSN